MWHVAEIRRGWSECVGQVQVKPSWRDYEEAPSVAALRTAIADVGESWRSAAVQSHTDGVLQDGRRLGHLFHLVTHSHHHRGHLLSMITLMGYGQPFEGGDF